MNVRAMVLSAGRGTRLAPLTDTLPKPLCPVGDRPQIDHVLAHLAKAGITRAVVNTHHLHEHFTDAWAAGQPLEIVRVHEPEILGTAGGIEHAKDALGPGTILVWNADILAKPDLGALVANHGGSLGATLVVGPARAVGEGTLGLDAEGRVARLRGRTFGDESRSADYAGIAMLGAGVRALLPENGCLVGDVLLPMLERGERDSLRTFALGAHFHDTGSPAEYLAANLAWLDDQGLASYLHPSARVAAPATLRRSIVGARAEVAGEGALDEVVVWPGAIARAPLRRCIVTSDAVLEVGAVWG